MPKKAKPARPAKVARPMYRVWRPDTDPDGDYAKVYDALDFSAAAKLYAERCYADHGWEYWPVEFHVQLVLLTAAGEEAAGDVYVVEVRREAVWAFISGEPARQR